MFDPIHRIDPATTRITIAREPVLRPARPRVVPSGHKRHICPKFLNQLRQIGRSELRIEHRIIKAVSLKLCNPQLFCHRRPGFGHELHEPARAHMRLRPWIKLAFAPRNRQRKLRRDRHLRLCQFMQRIICPGQNDALIGGKFRDEHRQIRVQAQRQIPKLPQLLSRQAFAQMPQETCRQRSFIRLKKQKPGLQNRCANKPGPAHVAIAGRRNEIGREICPDFLRCELPVKRSLIACAKGIGCRRILRRAHRFERAPLPISGPPERNRRRDREAEIVEMAKRLRGRVEIPQRDIPRQPFEVRVVIFLRQKRMA